MQTESILLVEALKEIGLSKKSLEEALNISSKQLDLEILDAINVIRLYLVSNNLLLHNPRLTMKDVKESVSEEIAFVHDEIHRDFIDDYITEKCEELIKTNKLFIKLEEIK